MTLWSSVKWYRTTDSHRRLKAGSCFPLVMILHIFSTCSARLVLVHVQSVRSQWGLSVWTQTHWLRQMMNLCSQTLSAHFPVFYILTDSLRRTWFLVGPLEESDEVLNFSVWAVCFRWHLHWKLNPSLWLCERVFTGCIWLIRFFFKCRVRTPNRLWPPSNHCSIKAWLTSQFMWIVGPYRNRSVFHFLFTTKPTLKQRFYMCVLTTIATHSVHRCISFLPSGSILTITVVKGTCRSLSLLPEDEKQRLTVRVCVCVSGLIHCCSTWTHGERFSLSKAEMIFK